MAETINFVIIGGSYAGLLAAKRLFAESKSTKKDIHVTLVSASTHVFYNIGSPRFLVDSSQIKDKAFFGVEKFLKQFAVDQSKYDFVYGKANKTDFDAKTVEVVKSDTNANITLSYDHLIIASGASAENSAFKLNGSFEDSRASLAKLSDAIKSANKIAIMGGGPTGVETAGEISQTYPEKKTIIYTGATAPLVSFSPKVSRGAQKQLKDLGVKVINNLKYSKIEKLGNGKEKVIFQDGTTETFDLVISSVRYFPNTQFVDSQFKTKTGYIKTNDFLCVEGYENVLVVGDAADKGDHTCIEIAYHHMPLIIKYLGAKAFGKNVKPHPYKAHGNLGVVPISRYGGVGEIYGWSIPKIVCRFAKSKDFFIPKSETFFT